MNRTDAIIELDTAIDSLERVASMVNSMGCTYYMNSRIQTKLRELTDLRVDIMQADFLEETD